MELINEPVNEVQERLVRAGDELLVNFAALQANKTVQKKKVEKHWLREKAHDAKNQ